MRSSGGGLLLVVLAVTGAIVASIGACGSSSPSIGNMPGPPGFTLPAGWPYGTTCKSGEYVLYTVPGCGENGYILCNGGKWAAASCEASPPAGYVPYGVDAGSDAGSGGDAGDSGG